MSTTVHSSRQPLGWGWFWYPACKKLGWTALVSIAAWYGGGFVVPVVAQDWNQWQGPQRDGRWNNQQLMSEFPAGGPPVLWRTAVSTGYAGPAIAGQNLVVLDYVRSDGDPTPNPGTKNSLQGRERVLCLDGDSGQIRWQRDYDCPYQISYPNGPRATPTIDGDRVYTLGAEGHLKCLRLEDGQSIWERELKVDFGLESAPFWGFAAHPLVDGDTLYCLVGGPGSVVVAFDKQTGVEKWRALTAVNGPGYCPPTMIQANGEKTLVIWHTESINGLNPETGHLQWSFELVPAYDMPIIAPVLAGDYLLATALQGTSLLLKTGPGSAVPEVVWRGRGIHSDHNPPLIVDGHIYGVSGRGQLHCCDLLTGERLWESLVTTNQGRPVNSATGFLVYNGQRFYIFIETGELIIADLSPQGCEELGRAQILEPTARTGNRQVVWSHPAFAGSRIYARNDSEIVCLELGVGQPSHDE